MKIAGMFFLLQFMMVIIMISFGFNFEFPSPSQQNIGELYGLYGTLQIISMVFLITLLFGERNET